MPIDIERLVARIRELTRRASHSEREIAEIKRQLATPSFVAMSAADREVAEQSAAEAAHRAAELSAHADEKSRIDEVLEKHGRVVRVATGDRAADHRVISKSAAAKRLGIGLLVGQVWTGFEKDWKALVAQDTGVRELVDLDAVRVTPAPSHIARRWLRRVRRDGDRA